MSAADIVELEARLDAARKRVERAGAALRASASFSRDRSSGDPWVDYERCLQAQLAAEREVALARGEPTCMPVPWKPRWAAGAPCPHVIAGHKTFLVYAVADADAAWDGAAARVIDPSGDAKERLAIVEFRGCYGHAFGGPNDEVWRGHRLYGKGLDFYGAHVVANSHWIAEQRATNEVHPQFRSDRWERLRHYLLLFHDEVFECLAEEYAIEETVATFGQVLGQLTRRVVGAG